MNLTRAVLIASVLVPLASRAHACDVGLFSGVVPEGATFLIAEASGDTVAANLPGTPARGQVVRLGRRVGGAAATLPPGAERALLVPWGASERCERLPWTGPAAWVPKGARALFVAVLRPRGEWAGGLPTFDVEVADAQPYPIAPNLQWGGAEGPLLGVDEMLDFIARWPTRAADTADPAAARRKIWEWARGHPDLAVREPAQSVLAGLCIETTNAAMKSIRSPLSGTYRVDARLTGETPRVFFARTEAHPQSGMVPREEADLPVVACGSREWIAHEWPTTGAESAAELPTSTDQRDIRREGWVTLGAAPVSGGDAPVWRGLIDPALVAAQYPERPAYRQFSNDLTVAGVRDRSLSPYSLPARFRKHPDGSVTFEQTIRLPDGRTLVLAGERVSDEVIQAASH